MPAPAALVGANEAGGAHRCTRDLLTKMFDAEFDFDQALAQAEEWDEEEVNVDKKLTDK